MRKQPARRGQAERNKIVLENMGLVYKAVHSLSAKQRQQLGGFDEADAIGCVALIRAADMFDETRGVAFSSYAYGSILRKLWSALRETNLIHVPHHAADQVAAERAKNVGQLMDGHYLPSAEQRDLEIDMKHSLRKLKIRQREVVVGHFRDGRHFKEFAVPYGVSRERIRQISLQGLEELRGRMAAWA